LDIVFSFGFVICAFAFVFYHLNKSSKAQKVEHDDRQDFLDQINKFVEKDREKDIIHETSVNKLTQEITSLKEKQSELLLNNRNWETTYNKLNVEYSKKVDSLEKTILELSEQKKKVTSQKKSSEVRLGHIAETLAPFLEQFEFDPETCTFLGKPIDYVSFGDEEITFIEVKSGKSQLSAKQRHIRDLVKSKLVSWKEVRIK
jgi:predicted Holliday junction resolvase-like endonuclease